jgi:hypothetical protein
MIHWQISSVVVLDILCWQSPRERYELFETKQWMASKLVLNSERPAIEVAAKYCFVNAQ